MNYLAVLVATIAVMVLGYIYYGPIFGKLWRKINNIKKEKKNMTKELGLGFVKFLITAYVFALFLDWLNPTDIAGALIIGFWIWFGFVITDSFSSIIWGKRKVKGWLLDIGYPALSFLIMTLILFYWV